MESQKIVLKIELLSKWDGQGKSKSELADLFGMDRRQINLMINEQQKTRAIDLGNRRLLRPHEIRLLILTYG